jgi:phosphate starvation-inducible PhoH-like protein
MGKFQGRGRRRVKSYDWDEFQRLDRDGGDWRAERDRDVGARVEAKKAGRLGRPEKPLTDRHKRYLRAVERRQVVLALGPAGTGKTSLACGVAVKLLRAGRVEKVVLSRPLVQCDEDLGILKGTLKEKTDPYVAPLAEALKEHLGAHEFAKLEASGVIEVIPLAVMRGRTFHNAVVILDEAQNATFGQLQMAITRCGHNCKLVINGDVEQVDLGIPSPLLEVWRLLAAPPRHKGYAFVRLTDKEVLRPDIVRFATRRLSRRRKGEGCDSRPRSGISTTRGAAGPAPSYGAWAAPPAHPSASSSGPSKRPASPHPRTGS